MSCHVAPLPVMITPAVETLPLGPVIRSVLREEFWCRLEGPAGYLHFGWDFYMYVGVPYPCPKSQELARGLGLFVEEYPSPYKWGGGHFENILI